MSVLEPKSICDDFYVRIEPDMQYEYLWCRPAEEMREVRKQKSEELLREAGRHVGGHATLGFTVWWKCPICHELFKTQDEAKWHCQESEATP
jgi:hypothetical protein